MKDTIQQRKAVYLHQAAQGGPEVLRFQCIDRQSTAPKIVGVTALELRGTSPEIVADDRAGASAVVIEYKLVPWSCHRESEFLHRIFSRQEVAQCSDALRSLNFKTWLYVQEDTMVFFKERSDRRYETRIG